MADRNGRARPSPDDAHRFSIDSSSIDVTLADMRERLGTRFLPAIPQLARLVITILHVVVPVAVVVVVVVVEAVTGLHDGPLN